ncbi:MAG: hypothetical protein K6U04_02375 [Armatimonadetes bacterium]|nr:hypothetical protein [Armatimonadota bacterium]
MPINVKIFSDCRRQRQNGTYSFDCLDLTVVTFCYRLVNLAELPGWELLRRGPVGIIPLVPLMRHEESPEEVLEKCVECFGSRFSGFFHGCKSLPAHASYQGSCWLSR